MAAKKDDAAELAAKMLRVLDSLRSLGGASYPLTLQRLAALTDPAALPQLLEKALKKRAFAGRVLIAWKKSLAAPLALTEDLDVLADSRLLLEGLLETICTPEQPEIGRAHV